MTLKILLITSTPPIPSWGGAMAFYRHFCERNDFHIKVITDNTQILQYQVPYEYSLIEPHPLWTRLARTRFSPSIHSWQHLIAGQFVPDKVRQQAIMFDPDAIFTVAGSWSWTTKMAGQLSKQLNCPLIGSFNDWWYYNLIYARWSKSLIERNFRQFYQQCDLALCTCEGMHSALGSHRNAVVFYPTGAKMPDSFEARPALNEKVFTVAFAGNLGEWYGRMLESLISEAKDQPIQFKIFGSNASWSNAFDQYVRDANIYQGQIPFDQLQVEMRDVDGLLLLMGFDDSCAQIEKTSFKTKFLDYLSFNKPIFLWGPDYCSAVHIAREFDSAEICTSAKAKDFLELLLKSRKEKSRQHHLVENARRMYNERFHPDKIHQLLVDKTCQLIGQRQELIA